MARPAPDTRTQFLCVLGTELRSLWRDRRALFSALVLPMLLYPLLFQGQAWLERASRTRLEQRNVRVGLDLTRAGPELAQRLRERLAEEGPIELVDIDAGPLQALEVEVATGAPAAVERERSAAAAFFDTGLEALLVAITTDTPPFVELRPYRDGAEDLSNEALRRIERARARVHEEFTHRRVQELLELDPAQGLTDLALVDVASAEDQGGAALGRLLPILAVFVLLSGGAAAALAAFAGERESGTLETLLVQPVPARTIAAAKFAAVLLTALVTLVCNGLSVLGTLFFGWGALPGLEAAGGFAVGSGRVLTAALVYLPSVALLSALLCLVCGRARTFREGQHLLLPLLLLALVPTLLATQDDVELDLLTAAIPLGGPALAMRDVLRGDVVLPLLAWMFAANLAWAALAVAQVGRILDGERVFAAASDEHEDAQRRVQSRLALRWGLLGVIAIYLVGSTLQNWSLALGLALTLLALLPLLGLLAARGTARRARARLASVLSLRAPRLAHLAGAVCLAPALVQLTQLVFAWQQTVLPLPSSFGESTMLRELEGVGPVARIALLALAPALGEEFFFRGAILAGLRRDLAPWKCALWQFALFGAAHASIHRFVPTGIVGALLTLVCLRTQSLWPAVLLHASYNSLLVSGLAETHLAHPAWALLALPGAALLLLPGAAARGGASGELRS